MLRHSGAPNAQAHVTLEGIEIAVVVQLGPSERGRTRCAKPHRDLWASVGHLWVDSRWRSLHICSVYKEQP